MKVTIMSRQWQWKKAGERRSRTRIFKTKDKATHLRWSETEAPPGGHMKTRDKVWGQGLASLCLVLLIDAKPESRSGRWTWQPTSGFQRLLVCALDHFFSVSFGCGLSLYCISYRQLAWLWWIYWCYFQGCCIVTILSRLYTVYIVHWG
jgi:hypothetical protein